MSHLVSLNKSAMATAYTINHVSQLDLHSYNFQKVKTGTEIELLGLRPDWRDL